MMTTFPIQYELFFVLYVQIKLCPISLRVWSIIILIQSADIELFPRAPPLLHCYKIEGVVLFPHPVECRHNQTLSWPNVNVSLCMRTPYIFLYMKKMVLFNKTIFKKKNNSNIFPSKYSFYNNIFSKYFKKGNKNVIRSLSHFENYLEYFRI